MEPSSELLYKKLEEGPISMVCTQVWVCSLLQKYYIKIGRRLYFAIRLNMITLLGTLRTLSFLGNYFLHGPSAKFLSCDFSISVKKVIVNTISKSQKKYNLVYPKKCSLLRILLY